MKADGNDYYYVHDHLYSPAALTDSSGTVVERYEYDAYGQPTILDAQYAIRDTSLYDNPYLFTGRRVDFLDAGNLRLQYNRNRYYDYYTGRWLSHDPMEYVDGMNLYEYVRSNPIMLGDPCGLWGYDMHYEETHCIAVEIGFSEYCADLIASANWDVDVSTPASITANQQYHFDGFTDWFWNYVPYPTRRAAHAELKWSDAQTTLKEMGCEFVPDALDDVGRALHGFQDGYSHNAKHSARTAAEHFVSGFAPDDATLWPDDWLDTSLDTRAKLQEIFNNPKVKCLCEED
jgi:RHS repeat-associated protein